MNLNVLDEQFLASTPEINRIIGSDYCFLQHKADRSIISARIGDGFTEVATFHLEEMPGCRGLLISCRSKIAEEYRGKGLGKILHNMRVEAAKMAGYSAIMCTTRANNEPQNKILRKSGWTTQHCFHNAFTGNEVLVWVKEL